MDMDMRRNLFLIFKEAITMQLNIPNASRSSTLLKQRKDQDGDCHTGRVLTGLFECIQWKWYKSMKERAKA
jgi:hypothetical protein